MILRCSNCGYVGKKNSFLRPTDIIPPNYCVCPNCSQMDEPFYIVSLSDEELDELDKFVAWVEEQHPDTWMTLKLLKKWIPIYRSSKPKVNENGK